jgi:hypothetical protein
MTKALRLAQVAAVFLTLASTIPIAISAHHVPLPPQ